MYPKIKLKSDSRKDVEAFFCFIKDAKYDGGRNLDWAIIKKYPVLKKYRNKKTLKIRKEQANAFISDIYKKNQPTMKKNLNLYSKNWKKIEKTFFYLTDNLFGNKHWPKGKYIAYLTIWGMFPRFLKDKTFQIPYNHENEAYVNVVIAHELLHFKFYDYFLKNYRKYSKKRYDFLVWHASEIFNAIVQNSYVWLNNFKTKVKTYPEHGEIIRKIEKEQKNKTDFEAKELIEDILREMEKDKKYYFA